MDGSAMGAGGRGDNSHKELDNKLDMPTTTAAAKQIEIFNLFCMR